MRSVRFAFIVVAVVAVAGAAAVFTPSLHGQTVTVQPAPRAGQNNLVQLLAREPGPQIGVTIAELGSAEQAKGESGVVVSSVVPDSPAAKAGVKDGDVIVEFAGERVRGAVQFQRLVRETPPGANVKMAVVRNGKRVDLSVTPGEQPAPNLARSFGEFQVPQFDEQSRRELQNQLRDLLRNYQFRAEPRIAPQAPRLVPNPRWPYTPAPGPGQLGITVQDLTPQLRDYFGASEGVLVAGVQDDSPAARAGLKAGDVITAIDGTRVGSRADLTRLLSGGAADRTVSVGVVRDRKPLTIKVTLGSGSRRIPI